MRIVGVITEDPNPPITGPRVRNFHLWKRVRESGHEVQLIALAPHGSTSRTIDGNLHIRPMDRYGPLRRAWLSFTRSHYEWPGSDAVLETLEELIRGFRPDILHAEELKPARFLPAFSGRPTASGVRCQTLTMHNVESELYASIGSSAFPVCKAASRRLHLRNLRRYEAECIRAVDHVFAYSAEDRRRYAALVPEGRFSVTSNGADVAGTSTKPDRPDGSVLILGSLSYAPNLEGLRWFFEKVRPRMRAHNRVVVAGSRASDTTKAWLAAEGVELIDTPLDLNPLYAQSCICLIPLLTGSGTRGRIPEAMSHGRLTVTTSKGAEGLDVSEEEGVVCCDDPEAFAAEVDRYLNDARRRCMLSLAARRRAEASFDWSVVARELVATWARMVG
jgi:polysaccharide biosynthesis protein PslH